MTPAFAELVERHVLDAASQRVIVEFLEEAALAASTREVALFWLTLQHEVADPSEVGPAAPRFVRLAACLDDAATTRLVILAGTQLIEEAFAIDLTRAGLLELQAASDEVDQSAEAAAKAVQELDDMPRPAGWSW